MDEAVAAPSGSSCPNCHSELAPAALACPVCRALVHGTRLRELAALAAAATDRGERATARGLWEQALDLVPPDSEQHRQIGLRLAALEDQTPGQHGPKPAGSSGPQLLGGIVAVALLVAGKFKFLLLGLGKLSTLSSMFGFVAVYWSIYGWPLAAGLVATLYIHEMGHVSVLRQLGIRADAPLFIPGVGAFVLLKEHITDPIVNARIGLAGPLWGLAAAIGAWGIHLVSGQAIWMAIAQLTGFLNLFNLTPVWQLDGARGFDALSRHERWLVLAILGGTIWFTDLGLLWLVGAVGLYRTVATEPGPGHTETLASFAVLVPLLAWFARAVS